MQLRLVEVCEVGAPAEEAPPRWLLLSTQALADVAKAWLIVSWYKGRWTALVHG